jgi:hypothetical protein
MKLKEILIFTGLLFAFFACDNDLETTTEEESEESYENTITYDASASGDEDMASFEITSAGIFNNTIYVNLSYTGGEMAHEFSLNSDGELYETEDGETFVKLDLYHLTNNDEGTQVIQDSLVISLSDIDISEELKEDADLLYKLVNFTDTENFFLLSSIESEEVEDDTEFTMELTIINSECSGIGEWENNWLKYENQDSVQYIIPSYIEDDITYVPTTDDNVRVTYEYSYISDIENIENCDFVYSNDSYAIKIKDIELITE